MTSPKIPKSLTEEHRELFHELRELAEEKGNVGSATRRLLTALGPHFEKEEESAMPLLGALRPLAEGKRVLNSAEVTSLHHRFASDYSTMLKEHKEVKRLACKVRDAAREAGNQHALALMAELQHHATVEEEVLYPAAILTAEFAEAGR